MFFFIYKFTLYNSHNVPCVVIVLPSIIVKLCRLFKTYSVFRYKHYFEMNQINLYCLSNILSIIVHQDESSKAFFR